jgi:hypothetical protein
MSFKQAILDQDLYASFVSSSEWISCLDKIREISPAVADAINKYGIGESICDDEPYAGQYEFESGQRNAVKLVNSVLMESDKYNTLVSNSVLRRNE